MNGLLVAVLGIALIDSLNLSAIAVTLYLLAGPSYVPRVLTYLAAVFSAYFTIGVLLMLGLTTAATAVGDAFYSPVAYAAQGVIGAVLLLYALAAPANAARQRPPRRPRSMHLGAVFVLGLTITVVEFSTALPYLGAIGLLTNAGVAPARWVPTLVAYNLIFVLPPFLLLVAYRLWGARLQRRFEGYRERLQRGSREAWLWILGLVGVVLLVDSLRYFDFFGLVDLPDVPPGQ
jgi:cytochrome c biogenesis protein CcdA